MTSDVRSPVQDAEEVYMLIFDLGMHSKRDSKQIEQILQFINRLLG